MKQITIARTEEIGTDVKKFMTALNEFHRNHVSGEAHLWATIEADSNGRAYASVHAYDDSAAQVAANSIKLMDFTTARHYTREDKQQFAESITKKLREALKAFEEDATAFSN